MTKRKFSPPLLIISFFFLVIVVTTLLQVLPFSTKEGISLIDAFFTQTSAVCVTGLTIKNTGSDFTMIGQLLILFTIQLGGLGIMTLSTFFYQIIKKDLSLKNQIVIRELVAKDDFYDINVLLRKVIIFTFTIEIIGAAFFAIRFIPDFGWGRGIYYSIFHSISSFCNAGFSTFIDSFSRYSNSPLVIITSSVLIILGGLGFLVLHELFELKPFKKSINVDLKKLSVQSKIMVVFTLVLIVSGAILFLAFESNNTMSTMKFPQKIMVSLFQSITTRTAGFNIVDTGSLRPITLLINNILMFIGAGSGSTAGGIKVTTFVLIIFVFLSFINVKENIVIYKRKIPSIIIFRAVSIFMFFLMWVVFSYLILIATNSNVPSANMQDVSQRLLFEIFSALGTVGLSTGITPYLNFIGKIVIIFSMFIGRLAPVIISLIIIRKDYMVQIEYPEEKIMTG